MSALSSWQCAFALVLAACTGSDATRIASSRSPASMERGTTSATSARPARLLVAGEIRAGDQHVCALVEGGVRCWGDNTAGQLGDGGRDVRGLPHPAFEQSGVTAIAAAARSTCAVLASGRVRCWGRGYAALEAPPRASEVPGLGDARTAATADTAGCAITRAGRARCWRAPSPEAASDSADITAGPVIDALGEVTQLAVSNEMACAVGADHALRCWGPGADGITRGVPILPVPDEPFSHLEPHGSAPGRGRGPRRIGSRDTPPPALPTSAATWPAYRALTGVAHVALSHGSGCAARTDGTAWCWGVIVRDPTGARGDELVQIPEVADAVEVALGADVDQPWQATACARARDGSVTCWTPPVRDGNGRAAPIAPVAVSGLTDATQITAGAGLACALRQDGSAWCWGERRRGQLGDGAPFGDVIARPVVHAGAAGAVELALSGTYGCARFDDGHVACWGFAADRVQRGAARGPGEAAERVLGVSDAVQIVLGGAGAYGCALRREGPPACWAHVPWTAEQLAPLAGASRLAGGPRGLCALMPDHTARCAGRTLCSLSSDPTDIGLQGSEERRVAELVVGGCHMCIVATDRRAYCVGENRDGQLGDGTRSYASRTHAVPDLEGVAQVVAGPQWTCARLETGAVECWGANGLGQLGDGTTSGRTSPAAPIGMDGGVTQLAAGREHACVVRADRTVWCWGANARGQLGDGTSVPRPRPQRVEGLSDAVDVAAGDEFTCARLVDRTVRCWGGNELGQLGTPPVSPAPVRVDLRGGE